MANTDHDGVGRSCVDDDSSDYVLCKNRFRIMFFAQSIIKRSVKRSSNKILLRTKVQIPASFP